MSTGHGRVLAFSWEGAYGLGLPYMATASHPGAHLELNISPQSTATQVMSICSQHLFHLGKGEVSEALGTQADLPLLGAADVKLGVMRAL